MESLLVFLQHEYILALYGVAGWHLEEFFRSKKTFKEFHSHAWRETGQALVWVGMVVVFDDEILRQYNEWAEQDYETALPWMYVASGFFITVIRSRIQKYIGKEPTKQET